MKFQKRLLNILFWSVISAAFIGPGTITTAAKSGNLYGVQLLWTLLFSTLACLLLQEAASRLTIKTGKSLGEAIRERLGERKLALPILIFIALAICGGSAAYEMGNLVGAKEGIALMLPGKSYIVMILLGASAALVLSIPSLKVIARLLGLLVTVLGMVFLYAAIQIGPQASEVLKGIFLPVIPVDGQASILVLGLIGTTIVPYNLFLASGLSTTQKSISEMRWGLLVAILLGGVFSMAVVIVGSALTGTFGFQDLALALGKQSGFNGSVLLGVGLFAAGFTSAITAPLASAITLKSLFDKNQSDKWKPNGLYFRLSWSSVLLIGFFFALINVKPIPAIIMTQALNGLILPFISFFLVWILNRASVGGKVNHPINTLLLGSILVVTLIIGLNNIWNSAVKVFGITATPSSLKQSLLIGFSVLITSLFLIRIFFKTNN